MFSQIEMASIQIGIGSKNIPLSNKNVSTNANENLNSIPNARNAVNQEITKRRVTTATYVSFFLISRMVSLTFLQIIWSVVNTIFTSIPLCRILYVLKCSHLHRGINNLLNTTKIIRYVILLVKTYSPLSRYFETHPILPNTVLKIEM